MCVLAYCVHLQGHNELLHRVDYLVNFPLPLLGEHRRAVCVYAECLLPKNLNIISNHYVYPAISYQDGCCEKALLHAHPKDLKSYRKKKSTIPSKVTPSCVS